MRTAPRPPDGGSLVLLPGCCACPFCHA